MDPRYPHITLLILAGGRARRMNCTDKGLSLLAGRPLVSHVLERFSLDFHEVIISANRNLEAWRAFGYKVITDIDADYKGPLAGIRSVLSQITSPWLLCLPCDMPLLPAELPARLWRAAESSARPAAMVHDGSQPQPLCCLLSADTLPSLQAYLNAGHRRSREWLQSLDPAIADFSDCAACFTNINTAEELASLSRELSG